MRFRKLRIASSVFWGLACVLLIVLWVRSYWYADSLRCPYFGKALHIQSANGEIIGFKIVGAHDWEIGTVQLEIVSLWDMRQAAVIGSRYRPRIYLGNDPFAVVQHWVPLLLSICAAAVSFPPLKLFRWSFSLRTLLIATTLVAVVLGVVVYLASK